MSGPSGTKVLSKTFPNILEVVQIDQPLLDGIESSLGTVCQVQLVQDAADVVATASMPSQVRAVS